MRIFKTKWFSRWAKEEKISDTTLKNAIDEIAHGLYEGNLGSWLIKKRLARKGQGKSGGYRTLISYRDEQRSIFVFGFSKNKTDNIKKNQETAFKKLSKDLQNVTENKLNALLKHGQLIEVE